MSPVRALNLIPSAFDVAGPVDELAVRFLADLHVVDVGILVAEEAADHLAFGREDEDPGVGARVDVAVLVDDDAAVAWPDHGLPVGAEAPARHRVERHQAAPHPHGLGLVRREGRQRESEEEGESEGAWRRFFTNRTPRLLGCRDRDEFRVPPACLGRGPDRPDGRRSPAGRTRRDYQADRREKVRSDARPHRGPGHSLADRAGITCFSCRREPHSRDFKAQEPTDAPNLLRSRPLRFASGMPSGRGPNASRKARRERLASPRHAGGRARQHHGE